MLSCIGMSVLVYLMRCMGYDMRPFKRGDRVRLLKQVDWVVSAGLSVGREYTIDFADSRCIRVKGGEGYWIQERAFELIEARAKFKRPKIPEMIMRNGVRL